MIKTVIFDYGGTLVKVTRPWREIKPEALAAAYAYLVKKGLNMSQEDFVKVDEAVFKELAEQEKYENRDIPDTIKYGKLVARLFPDRPKSWRETVRKHAMEAYVDVMIRYHRPAKGVRGTLGRLRSKGLKLAVISNHSNHAALVGHLDSLKVSPHFVRVFSSSQVGLRKPDPSIFHECLRILRAKPSESIYVGNSLLHDVVGAKRAGLSCIWVDADPSGFDEPKPQASELEKFGAHSRPDFTVKELTEIPDIIKQINFVSSKR